MDLTVVTVLFLLTAVLVAIAILLAVAALCTIGPAFAVMQLHLSLGTAVVGAVLVPLGVVLLGRTVRLN